MSVLTRLLAARTWRAFDVDDAGRTLAGSDESGSVQLVELTPDGGAGPDGGVVPLTALPGACRGRYLPGRRAVVVEHDEDGNERGQLSLLAVDPPPEQPIGPAGLTPLVRDPAHVHRLADVLPGRVVYLTNRRNGVDFDVVVRNVATGAEQVVYDRGGMVLSATASPDGRWVLLTLPGVPAMSHQLVLVDTLAAVEADRAVALTGADEAARYGNAQWVGDGLVVSTDSGRDLAAVAHLDVTTGHRRWLVTDDAAELAGWASPDGATLLVVADDDGRNRLALHDTATGERRRELALPAEGVVTFPMPDPVFSPDGRFAALSFSAPTVPADVALLDVATGTVRVRTDSAAPLADLPLLTPTSHRVPTADGEHIPCFVYRPQQPDGSAVLVLHGGPEGQSVRSFSPVVQALAAQGHTVVVPNVRGSTGYGKRWYSLDDTTKRLDSVADLAALHDALPGLGCDPARAALWGGSYGGYLVLAGLAMQPRHWAAGVDIVGISSLVTFLENTSPYRRAHREREYGSLRRDRAFLHQASPLTHVHAIRAPLFVVHGANDPRVPLSEAEQLAAAVRANGVACELVVYPDEGHGLAKRANRLDAYSRALAFLARTLRAG